MYNQPVRCPMSELKDMLALSFLAFKQGKFDEASKFFVSAMGMEGLDTFISEITNNPPVAKNVVNVPNTENTFAPSLSSTDDIDTIVSRVSSIFEANASSLYDLGDYEEEARSSFEDDEDGTVLSSEECCGNAPCKRTASGTCPVYNPEPEEYENKEEEPESDEDFVPVTIQLDELDDNSVVVATGYIKLKPIGHVKLKL